MNALLGRENQINSPLNCPNGTSERSLVPWSRHLMAPIMDPIMDIDRAQRCLAQFAQHGTVRRFLPIVRAPYMRRGHVDHLAVRAVVQRADLPLLQGCWVAWDPARDEYGALEGWGPVCWLAVGPLGGLLRLALGRARALAAAAVVVLVLDHEGRC